MILSKNFSLVELTKSQTAERKGIANDPSPDHQENLRLLCERVLQPVRDHFNHVVSVSSGYRSPALCAAIGSSVDSQHAKGMAADFEIYGTPNNEIFNWIKNNLMFDQMILEFWNQTNRIRVGCTSAIILNPQKTRKNASGRIKTKIITLDINLL